MIRMIDVRIGSEAVITARALECLLWSRKRTFWLVPANFRYRPGAAVRLTELNRTLLAIDSNSHAVLKPKASSHQVAPPALQNARSSQS